MQGHQSNKLLSTWAGPPMLRLKIYPCNTNKIQKLYVKLASGDVDGSAKIFEESRNVLSLEEFYDKVLKLVMYEIGMKWEKGVIDITTEHVCTNTVYGLLATINERISKSGNHERILLCCPEGELHALSASVIESVLKSRGYKVFNATPSI